MQSIADLAIHLLYINFLINFNIIFFNKTTKLKIFSKLNKDLLPVFSFREIIFICKEHKDY